MAAIICGAVKHHFEEVDGELDITITPDLQYVEVGPSRDAATYRVIETPEGYTFKLVDES